MNRSINVLSLGLFILLGACSVSDNGKEVANLELTAFAKSVRGKAIFTPTPTNVKVADNSMQVLFDHTGVHGKLVKDESLNSDKYEYTLVEAVSDTVAIYSVTTTSGTEYVVFKLAEYTDTNTGIKTITVYVSDLLSSVEQARQIANSTDPNQKLNVYGSLTNPADPSKIIHNPYTVIRDLIKGKTFTINDEKVVVKDNGDIVYNGKDLLLLVATANKATMADSRNFIGSYYEDSNSGVNFYLSIEITDLDYTKVTDFAGNVTVKRAGGTVLTGKIVK